MQHPAKIDEVREHVLLIERLIVGQRATKERLGLDQPIGIPEQPTQLIAGIVQAHPADPLGVGSKSHLRRGQFAAHQRLGCRVARLRVVDFDQVPAGGARE